MNNYHTSVIRKAAENEYYKNSKDEGTAKSLINGDEVFDYKYHRIVSLDLSLDVSESDITEIANSDGFENCYDDTEDADEFVTVSVQSSCSHFQKEVEDFASTSNIDSSGGIKNAFKTRFTIDSKYMNIDSNNTVGGK